MLTVHPHCRVFGASCEYIPRLDGYNGCFGWLHVILQGLGSCWSSKAGSLWQENVEIKSVAFCSCDSTKLVFAFCKVCSASLLRCCARFPQLQKCESWLEKYLVCWKCPVQLHWKNPCGFWAACACAASDSELVPAGKSTRLSVTYSGLDREAASVVNACDVVCCLQHSEALLVHDPSDFVPEASRTAKSQQPRDSGLIHLPPLTCTEAKESRWWAAEGIAQLCMFRQAFPFKHWW